MSFKTIFKSVSAMELQGGAQRPTLDTFGNYPPFRNYYAINPSKIIPGNDYANVAQSSQK